MLTTRVDTPTQVFDVYARFIGDIVVRKANRDVNVNGWMVEQGWAFPAFYTTMRNDEIRALQSQAKKAQKAQGAANRVWGQRAGHVTQLDVTMRYRPNGPFNAQKDIGPVLMPNSPWWKSVTNLSSD